MSMKTVRHDRLATYLKIAWAPLFFAALFVLQNHAYNQWAGLTQFYFVRRTLATLGTGALLFGPGVLLARRPRYMYLGIISSLTGLVLVVQFLYFSYYGSFLQASALKYASQAGAVSDTVGTLISPLLLFFIIGIPVAIIAYFTVGPDKEQYQLNLREQLAALGIMLLVFAAGNGYVVAKEIQRWGNASRLYKIAFDNADVVRKLGVVNYTGIDFIKQAFKRRGVSETERELARKWTEKQLGQPPAAAGSAEPKLNGVAKGRNVVFIQLESVEGWVLGKQVHGQEITPNLNDLARQGLKFNEFYQHVGPGTTSDAEFQILTSMYAPMTEVPFFEYPANDYYAFPEILKAAGYKSTAVFHGDEKTFWNRTAIYPQLGIDQYLGIESYRPTRQVIWGLSDYEFFQQSVPKLKEMRQPFFVNLMALTSHTPFDLPRDLVRLKVDYRQLGISDFQARYIETVNYVDYSLGVLMDELKAAGLYENSLFVIYGDHKAQIAPIHDNGFAAFEGYGGSYDKYEYLKHMKGPMVLLAPGSSLQGEVSAPGTHVDMLPTLANLLGLPLPPSAFGQDLLNPLVGGPGPFAPRRNDTGTVDAVVTDGYAYFVAEEGNNCVTWPQAQPAPEERCLPAYRAAAERTRLSDIFLRGNLINLFKPGQ